MPPRSLLDVDDLAPAELVAVLDRAMAFRDALPPRDLCAGVPVLNLFFEASTRTADFSRLNAAPSRCLSSRSKNG